MTGNVAKLAKAVAEGAASVKDTEVRIRQVEELVPKDKWNEVMKKVKEELKDKYIDRTGGLWLTGCLLRTILGLRKRLERG